jgi:hypothetical protein
MNTKIDFFVRTRIGGGFVARAYDPPMQAEGDTLVQLRQAIKRLVSSRLGVGTGVCLRVGEVAARPELRRVPATPALRAT